MSADLEREERRWQMMADVGRGNSSGGRWNRRRGCSLAVAQCFITSYFGLFCFSFFFFPPFFVSLSFSSRSLALVGKLSLLLLFGSFVREQEREDRGKSHSVWTLLCRPMLAVTCVPRCSQTNRSTIRFLNVLSV